MKGKILGSRYKIIEYLAEGGFGRTYLAEDTQLPGKDVCLVKQLYPSRSDPKFLEIARRLFKTEASTLHNLGHHQQIPELLAYFEESEKFYLVQQYIKGATLTTELDSGQIWTELQAIALLRDGSNILQFVHEKQVIHRDIKPDNLIRRESDGRIVLVDFGSVKQVLQEQQTNIGQLTVAIGTQGYMPTEQARGKPRLTSDIYALGMIGIQALTGIAPLDLPEDDDGEIIWESSAQVSPELAAILTRMTRYHFKDRYGSVKEVLQELDRLPTVATEVQSSTTDVQLPIENGSLNNTIEVVNRAKRATLYPSTVNHHDLFPAVTEAYPTKSDATVIESQIEFKSARPSPPKSKNKNLPVLVMAFAILVLGLGAYLMMQQFDLKLDKLPVNQPLDNPNKSQERMEQGEGFRKDI